MRALSVTTRRWLLVALFLVVIVVGQATASATAPSTFSATGRTIGAVGFSYLTGLRTFVAATLWNRIEPLFHTYYENIPFERQRFMMPTLRMVTWLDPQFVQAYSIASWVLFKSNKPATGIAIARDGLAHNPDSGLAHAALAQLLFIEGFDKHRAELIALSRRIASSEVVWTDDEDEFEGLAVARDIFIKSGDAVRLNYVETRLAELRASGAGQRPTEP
ncbi:MAG: hypothetical protein FDZ75_04765 [Actinobacteria bacterium]|nr:MAG: hypothetical protein FDZ75_04765 [Actinomycetota bacterium]